MTLFSKITQSGFRLTAPRRKIIDVLSAQLRPISFEEYASIDPETDKSTFYRTMQAFEHARLVSVIESEEGRRYFEISEDTHPHFVCQTCRAIRCLETIRPEVPAGYTVTQVIYKGICKECSAQNALQE